MLPNKIKAKVYQGYSKGMQFAITLLILLTLCVGTAWGDTNDSIANLQQLADNTAVSTEPDDAIPFSWSTLILSTIASIIAAVIVLFLFFGLLRPRLNVLPMIAYHDEVDEKTKDAKRQCEILVQNKSLFACNDIRAEISMHFLSDSGDEIRLLIDDPRFLTIAGCLHNENDSNVLISFDLEPLRQKDGSALFPKRVLLEILAQHSLSGIILPTKKLFTTNDFSEGHYVKSELVEKGKTYKQAVMKSNLKRLKQFSLITAILLLVIAITLFAFTPLKPHSIILLMTVIALMALCYLTLWQVLVYTRAEAFTRINFQRVLRTTIRELHLHKHIPEESDKHTKKGAEDVDYEEIEDKNSQKHLE